MSFQSTTQHSFSLSTAGLMDRHLHSQPDKDEVGEPSKTAKAALMKELRLFRIRKGGVVAVISGQHKRMVRYGRTIYTLSEASTLSIHPDDPIYVLWGDTCTMAVGGVYDNHKGVYDETEASTAFRADALFNSEGPHTSSSMYDGHRFPARSHTPSSGRTTPELCWSPTPTNFTEELEEIDVEELDLESIFHQFIDISQCEG